MSFHTGLFANSILKCIFMKEKFCIFIQISEKFVPKAPIYNKSELVQVIFFAPNRQLTITEPMMAQFDTTLLHNQTSLS